MLPHFEYTVTNRLNVTKIASLSLVKATAQA